MPVSDVAVTVPAHWSPSVVGTLRRTLRDGLPVVSDTTAALTALRANPGLPTRGVIVLCDFGGSGTSITFADAATDFAPIGETVRYPDFSGDLIDQALLTHVAAGLFDASQTDPSDTAMVGSLVRLRDECRRAKERLSAETATAVVANLPEHRAEVRVTRSELEDLIRLPLANFLAALDDTLERGRVPLAAVSAVATVGGGARIPLITQLLSERMRAPVVTAPHPQLTAAEGASLIASRSRLVETATTMTPAPATAVPAAAMGAGEPSTSFGALAWSEDVDADYADTQHVERPADSRPELNFRHEEAHNRQPSRRAPILLFGLSAAAALITTAVFGFTMLGRDTTAPAATTVTPSPAPAAPAPVSPPPAPQAPHVTTVLVQRSNPAPQQPRPQQPVTQPPTQAPTQPATTTPTTTTSTTTTSTTKTPTTTPPATPPTSPPTTPPTTPPTVPRSTRAQATETLEPPRPRSTPVRATAAPERS